MDKQRNRDNRRQKQKLHAKKGHRGTLQTTSTQLKNVSAVTNEHSSDEDNDDVCDMFDYVSQNFVQPKSRYASYPEGDSKSTIDFEDLANAAVSCAYFQFKSEKNWIEDISKYSELLAVDIRNLETIIDCIPYHQLVEVDEKYFTENQLTYFNSRAEQSEKLYESELLKKEKTKPDCQNDDFTNKKNTSETNETDKADNDLDFLLSLKEPEPVQIIPVANACSLFKDEESKVPVSRRTTNSIDLEKWLDSVLDI